jgi:uncharacterized protein YjbJ (UPF0337 family)
MPKVDRGHWSGLHPLLQVTGRGRNFSAVCAYIPYDVLLGSVLCNWDRRSPNAGADPSRLHRRKKIGFELTTPIRFSYVDKGPPPTHQPKEMCMNKDQVKGRVETAKGDVKEAAGKLVGDHKLQAKGLAEQAAGKTQSTAGDVKAKVGDAVKKALDK